MYYGENPNIKINLVKFIKQIEEEIDDMYEIVYGDDYNND